MDEKHKKRGRRSHLNDFHLNVAGEYVYDGSLFACRSSEESLRGSKRAVWIMAAALALAVVAGGCIPAPGMQNCFYVLLPYLGEVVAAASSERTGARCASTTTKKAWPFCPCEPWSPQVLQRSASCAKGSSFSPISPQIRRFSPFFTFC